MAISVSARGQARVNSGCDGFGMTQRRTTSAHAEPKPRNTFRRLATATLASVAMLAAVVAAPAAANAENSRPELHEAIQEVVDIGFLGVQLRVDDEQGEWAGSAGSRELGSSARPRTDGLFRVGSATKAFTSALVLQLVDEGRVGLDDSAAGYLPEFGLNPGITVRMLLQHTSGVFNFTGEFYTGTFQPGIPVDGKEWVDNRFKNYEPEELVRFALSKPQPFSPGDGWSYSNTNYVLARLLVEHVTGDSFPKAMRERILRPLGLHDTVTPEGRPGIPGPHAHGYFRYQDTDGAWKAADVSRQNPSWLSTGGDMISSTEDLGTFLSATLHGELFSDDLVAEMVKPEPRSPNGYGLGLSVQDFGPACGGTLVNINGYINGYAAVTFATLDGGKTMSGSITTGDADIDLSGDGGVAIGNLVTSVFCETS